MHQQLTGYDMLTASVHKMTWRLTTLPDCYRFASPIKRWNFGNMDPWHFWKPAWGPFSKKIEKRMFFKLFWKKGSFSNWVWKNTPLGPGSRALARASRALAWDFFFKLSLKTDLFSKSFAKWPLFFSIVFENGPQAGFQKCHRAMFSKFHLLIRDANRYRRSIPCTCMFYSVQGDSTLHRVISTLSSLDARHLACIYPISFPDHFIL